MKKIIFPDGLERLGFGVFWGCGFEDLVIPEGVVEVPEEAFSFCVHLKRIRLSDRTTKIGDGAFLGCESLESVTIPEGVTGISWGTFSRCRKLREVIRGGEVYPARVVSGGCMHVQSRKVISGYEVLKGKLFPALDEGAYAVGKDGFYEYGKTEEEAFLHARCGWK